MMVKLSLRNINILKKMYVIQNFSTLHKSKVRYCTLTVAERSTLIEKLNAYNEEEFFESLLSPLLIKRIISERERIGSFKTITDIRFCGLSDIKISILNNIFNDNYQSSSELQEIIYNSLSANNINSFIENISSSLSDSKSYAYNLKKKKSSSQKKTYTSSVVSSNFSRMEIQEMNNSVALSVSLLNLAWTKINKMGEVNDMGCNNLFFRHSSAAAIEYHELYEKVLSATRQLPESDCFIVENFSATSSNSAMNRLLDMQMGMLFSLLDNRATSAFPHPLVYLQQVVVTRLFKLKVGNERKTRVDIGELILSGKSNVSLFSRLTFHPKPLQRYILADDIEKMAMIDSFLLAVAFYSCVFGSE